MNYDIWKDFEQRIRKHTRLNLRFSAPDSLGYHKCYFYEAGRPPVTIIGLGERETEARFWSDPDWVVEDNMGIPRTPSGWR